MELIKFADVSSAKTLKNTVNNVINAVNAGGAITDVPLLEEV